MRFWLWWFGRSSEAIVVPVPFAEVIGTTVAYADIRIPEPAAFATVTGISQSFADVLGALNE